MGQVPKYLIIGSGRVAKHLKHYFDLLGIQYLSWHRSDEFETSRGVEFHYTPRSLVALQALLPQTTHVLLAISDQAIESIVDLIHHLLDRYSTPLHVPSQPSPVAHSLPLPLFIHFSGALETPKAVSAHPLMSFSKESLYSLDLYKKIPFITVQGRASFRELFPQLPNNYFEIRSEQKPLYHALCVLAGNYSTLLWQKMFTEFQSQFNIDRSAILPYLEQITENLKGGGSIFTGPLSRGDQATLDKNLKALQGDSYQGVYQSFIQAYNESEAPSGKAPRLGSTPLKREPRELPLTADKKLQVTGKKKGVPVFLDEPGKEDQL